MQFVNRTVSGQRSRNLSFLALTTALAVFSLGGGLYGDKGVALAQISLTRNPQYVRVAHLSSDTTPGRLDYVILAKGSGSPTLSAYKPGGTQLFSITPGVGTQQMTQLVDVVDLNNDGNAEIIGIYPGNGTDAPALYFYNGAGALIRGYSYTPKTTLSVNAVKVYDLTPSTGSKRVVAVPDTFNLNNTSSDGIVYFYNSDCTARTTLTVEGSGVAPNREIMTFPSVVAGAINGVSTSIFVVVKSRILSFSQDGLKIYYKQFSDPTHTGDDIGYDSETHDFFGGNPTTYGGRRYGITRLVDVTGDGKLDLVIGADVNPITFTNPGPVYQAYDIPLNGLDGYLGPLWSTYLPRTATAYAPSPLPSNSNYVIGVPMKGIDDINGDGIPDIVVTEQPASGNPVIKIINARTGAVTSTGINGICLDVRKLSTSLSYRDLIVYTPSTNQHSVWRIQSTGSYTLAKLTESPSGTLSTGAAVLVQQEFPNDQALDSDVGVASYVGHFAVMDTRTGGTRGFVGYSTTTCPIAVRTWMAPGTTVQSSLDQSPRPGLTVNVLKVTNSTDFVWVVEDEVTCGDDTNKVTTYVQSGTALVPNGDL